MPCFKTYAQPLLRLAAGLALATGISASLAQTQVQVPGGEPFPSRVVTIIVPYAAGSPPDQYSRIFAEKLRPKIGQNVIVENRPGALTTVGMGFAARSKPDGHTIVYGSNSSLAAAPWLFKQLQYDPIKSFSAIAVTQDSPMVLIGRPEDARIGLGGMLERMRKEPGKHPIGGGAITQEVINKMLQSQAKIDQPYARYNNPNINNDLLGGRLDIVVSALAGISSLVEEGKIHVFASTSPTRLPGKWKDIPTVAETLPGFELTSWTGFWVPAGTPKPVINFLHAKTHEILRDPDFSKRGEDTGARTVFMTPEQSDAYVKSEAPRWEKLLKSVGIEPQ